MSKNSSITLHGEDKNNLYKDAIPSEDEELIKWATQRFGGVTSFTTIQNLKTVHATGTGEVIPFSWLFTYYGTWREIFLNMILTGASCTEGHLLRIY